MTVLARFRRPAGAPTPTTQLLPTGPLTLDESYALCREFNKRHGTTYYWSTKVLPKVKQHHVHALYAFARYADDIVDEMPSQGGADLSTEAARRPPSPTSATASSPISPQGAPTIRC